MKRFNASYDYNPSININKMQSAITQSYIKTIIKMRLTRTLQGRRNFNRRWQRWTKQHPRKGRSPEWIIQCICCWWRCIRNDSCFLHWAYLKITAKRKIPFPAVNKNRLPCRPSFAWITTLANLLIYRCHQNEVLVIIPESVKAWFKGVTLILCSVEEPLKLLFITRGTPVYQQYIYIYIYTRTHTYTNFTL